MFERGGVCERAYGNPSDAFGGRAWILTHPAGKAVPPSLALVRLRPVRVGAGLMPGKRLLLHLRSSLWFVPVLCVLAGAAISFGTIALDRAFGYEAIPASVVGGPDAAMAILSTVAASMVSLTALVLTITMVVVQLAMGQFSPRIVQRILRDKPSQLAIGLFVATFVHAILAAARGDKQRGRHRPRARHRGPDGFLLVLASIAVLVIYVQHIGQALRVSALIELVGKDTRELLDRVYPDKGDPLADEHGAAGGSRDGVRRHHGDRLERARRRGAARRLRAGTCSRARRIRARRCAAVPRPRGPGGAGRGSSYTGRSS